MLKGIWKLCGLVTLAAVLLMGASLISDYHTVTDQLIRLHVVANSDSAEDQAVKLRVKDAVVEKLEQIMQNMPNAQQAREYLQSKLPELEELANRVLAEAGFQTKATVSLRQESFGTRQYDTFALPSGVYESLRIEIGSGEGQNWWCVVFPTLCIPATSEGFSDAAAGSGFSDTLTSTLTGQPGYEIRFFFLDCLGKMENLFFRG
ncbi:MAG: stage II sporulation protein R [Faecousia sp.]